MIRLLLPFLAVVVVAWLVLYGIDRKDRKKAWAGVRHALVAITIGFAAIAVVSLIFSLIGGLNG